MARMTTGLQPACRSCPTGFLMAVRGDGGPACRAMAPDPHTAFGASNQEWTTIDGNPSRQPRRRLLTRLRRRLHAVVRVQWERGLLFRELPEIRALVVDLAARARPPRTLPRLVLLAETARPILRDRSRFPRPSARALMPRILRSAPSCLNAVRACWRTKKKPAAEGRRLARSKNLRLFLL